MKKIKDLEEEIKRLKSAVEELRVLNEIAVSAGRATNVDEMLNLVVQKSTKAINAEQGSILLVTSNKKDPFTTIIRQDDTSSLKHSYHVGANITGWVLLNKKPLIIENLAADKRFYSTEDEKKDIHSVLCVPIWFEGLITGIMMTINKKDQKPFSMSDLTLLSIISVQAGQLIKNLQLQQETFKKIKETEKLQELDRLKTNFFTNISHEFRTPLTLILGPLEKLMNDNRDEHTQSQYKLIQKNASSLLKLINQLLDLAAIDGSKMKINPEKGDIISFIKGITADFNSLAEIKNVDILFNSDYEEILIEFDKDKFEKIISNLLSNALKFTGENGKIYVSAELFQNNKLKICVEDTGIGIPRDKINYIFDRFYKNDDTHSAGGTGIGLALVKELVELHGGNISVESEIKKGTKFKLTFPVKIESFKKSQTESREESKSAGDNINREVIETEENEAGEVILIVEDNDDIRKFIKENIGSGFRILEASNGKSGIEKAINQIPDLIISDILMPETDGIELCKTIKSDERTNHIPVILLTAKSSVENKLTGLETGADDYLTKPFHVSELQVRANNLILQRKKLRERFRKEVLTEPKDIAVASADEKFISRAVSIIENHIADYNFSVDAFAGEIGMSRMQLHRKLHAVTDQSASEFIRNYRLKKAAKLLSGKSGNIAEIAYDVGFNNPSYFSDCFKKLFGSLPSDYIRKLNENK